MKTVILFFVLCSSQIIAQSGYAGFKTESLTYWKKFYTGETRSEMLPILVSYYFKVNLFYENYEIEVKGGIQLDEAFVGPEFGTAFKYNAGKKLFPLLCYLYHNNVGDSRTGSGTHSGRMDFLGMGIETRMSRVFGMDLIVYLPINKNRLGYSWTLVPNTQVTTLEITWMIKLGFIFNIGAPII